MSEQVYCILCEEIQAGRWRLGDRLPGAATLSADSGLTRAPIQQALARLGAEGWVESRARSGTYLRAVLPFGQEASGAIGIAMLQDPVTLGNTTSSLHLHAILERAAHRDLVTEVVRLPATADWASLDRRDAFFSLRVKGIISLHAYPRLEPETLPEDRLPLVFWGSPFQAADFGSRPFVAHDTRYGAYLLTRKVLDAGHRAIAVCATADLQEELVRQRYEGYARAMHEARLAPDKASLHMSRKVAAGNTGALGDFLERIVKRATALVCFTQTAPSVVAWADRHRLSIPGDLSVVGHMPEPLRSEAPARRITGIDYRLNETADLCFGILQEQLATRRSTESVILLKPGVTDGVSLAGPNRGVR